MIKRLSMIASAFALVALFMMQASAKEITVRGRLGRTVESGGWLIIADTDEQTTKYLLLNPQRFKNESWFRVGAQVEAVGEIKTDVMTIYQEGVPFEARTMRSVGSSGNTAASDKPPTRKTRPKAVRSTAQSKRRRNSKLKM